MSDQPEALRLAELFELEDDPESQYRKAAALLRRQHAEIELLKAERDVLRAERDQARACLERATALIGGIHALMYPPHVALPDGRMIVFRPENPHEYLQALSDRIRALPDELAALKEETDALRAEADKERDWAGKMTATAEAARAEREHMVELQRLQIAWLLARGPNPPQ